MGKRALATLIGTAVIGVSAAGLGGRAAAVPDSEFQTAAVSQPPAILVTVDQAGEFVNACIMQGDIIEVRAAIGAALGALAWLSIFVVGAGFGALSWVICARTRRFAQGR